ncbi:DUF885 domain-containing protein [Ferrimonas marina]|nr:DUF885 domain-containing protein [Ferrimonas marina]
MIKKILVGSGVVVLTAAVVAGGFAAHEWYADKPVRFRSLVDREVVKLAFDNPEMLTTLGVLESVGINRFNAKLNNNSPEHEAETLERVLALKAKISAYEDEQLSPSDQLSKSIALFLLDQAEDAKRFRLHNYPVNQLFGVQNGYPSFMQAQHPINDPQGAEHYLSRLTAVGLKFDQTLEGLELREQAEILPPRFVVDRVLDEMTAFTATPVKENILYTTMADKMANSGTISDEEQQTLLAEAERRIQSEVYPAYQRLIDYFERVAPKTGNDHGLWHLPQGDEAYQASLRFYTTTDMSAESIHQLGLSEVARIQAEILTILEQQGFDTEQGFTAAIDALAADPRFYYEDSDEGRAQILADYQTILDEINEGLSDAFRIRPDAGMEVVRIPEFKEATAPGAYYQPPSLDGSRPGRFFANLYDIQATPTYGMRTLAYHEGIPGHHFQIALGLEQRGLPFFRRFAPFTAYIEGWALYSEYLAWELGFQQEPLDNVGRLQAELFRAVRLVVDTGIHAKRWTREEAIDYMQANTGIAQSDVVSEIERYIVMPGQATSYKVGMIKILALREKAQTALGDRFDLRDFHDVVLQNGAVPLTVLEQLVDNYIAEQQA